MQATRVLAYSMIIAGVNILTSYIAWCIATIFLREKIKDVRIYVAFPIILYSLPCIKCITQGLFLEGVIPLLLSIGLYLYCIRHRSDWSVALIPLPQVLAILYTTVVLLP